MADTCKRHLVDNQLRMVRLEPFEREAVVGVDDKGTVVQLLHMGVDPFVDFVNVQLLGGLEDNLEVVIGGQVAFKLCTGFDSQLRVLKKQRELPLLSFGLLFLSHKCSS